MPKDAKSRKNGSTRKPSESVKGEILLKSDVDEDVVYGQTTRILGDCNFMVMCYSDGKERLCHLRKAVKKGEKVTIDTIVLVGLRDYQDEKGDIVYVYKKEHANELRQKKEIPSKVSSNQEMDEDNTEETGFDFNTI